MKIAVVGAGLFGTLAALKLSESGHDVTLFEKNPDILSEATAKNQYRLHRGYHYPRSKETAIQSKMAERTFLDEFSNCITNLSAIHYYAIAEDNSLTDSFQFEEFLDEVGLPYINVTRDSHTRYLFNMSNIANVYQVREESLDVYKLRNVLWQRLTNSSVSVRLNEEYQRSYDAQVDIVINATYANYNKILPPEFWQEIQFEYCEKVIIHPPKQLQNTSIVILDGPFGCIDPISLNMSVLGHVEDAILHRNIGYFPEYPIFSEQRDSLTVYKNVLDHLQAFIPDIFFSNYCTSMFVHRAVLPNREHDDARPSYITKHSDKYYSIFSGKLGTAVDIANELNEMI